MQPSQRSTCKQPYLHPIRRGRSEAFSMNGTRSGGACIGPDQAKYADNFPSLSLSSSSSSEKSTTSPTISSTVSFSQLISNKVDEICNDIDANVVSLPAGWVEITLNDVRTEQRNRQPKKSSLITHKDDFLRRIHEHDNYIQSLDNETYANICNHAMNKVVAIHRRHKYEFIEMYGYDYYDNIYGYKPIYGRRSVRRPIRNDTSICRPQDPEKVDQEKESYTERHEVRNIEYMDYYSDSDIDDESDRDIERGATTSAAVGDDILYDDAFDDYD